MQNQDSKNKTLKRGYYLEDRGASGRQDESIESYLWLRYAICNYEDTMVQAII